MNAAGASPGDVGFWNCHFRIGGAAGSKVETNCGGSPAQCKADWGLIHLTSTSSAYIENMWGWCADHDLDGGNGQTISCGRGMLVEATSGTWLVGTAMEHHTLYQYNFNGASDVVSSFQQSETPYWQGSTGSTFAPAPWEDDLASSDPDFSNCAADDGGCRMAWFELINNSNNMFLYGGCVWTFFNGGTNNPCNGDCQQNAILLEGTMSSTYLYGTNVKAITNIIDSTSADPATEAQNSGGWGGCIASYQELSSSGGSGGGSGSGGNPGNGNIVTGAGLSWYDPNFANGNAGYDDPQFYNCFGGPAANFPPMDNWMNYNDMFTLNQATNMVFEEDGPTQGDIYNAIQEISIAAQVDARLILAVVMQEVCCLPQSQLKNTKANVHSPAAAYSSYAQTTKSRIAVSCNHITASDTTPMTLLEASPR